MSSLMRTVGLACVALGVGLAGGTADAADKVRLVISQKMPFELFAPELAQREGHFKAENLDVSMIYATGGAETLQAIITGSQDVTTGNGTLGVIAAYAKGAPLTIIASSGRGTGDVFWYVPTASPIKTLKDLDGKELVFSRPGSTTHLIAQLLAKQSGANVKLVSVGGMSASRTQVMSGQVATGWAAFPANYELIRKGEARILAKGDEATALQGDSIRVVVANSNWLKANRDVAARFMRAHWKGIQGLYTAKGVEQYAKLWDIPLEDAKRAPDFVPMKNLTYNPVGNLDGLIQQAIALKMINGPLTPDKRKAMVDIVWEPEK